MEVLTNNNTSYDIPVTYNSTKNKDILSFIEILKSSNLLIEDPYNIFSLYPETNLDFIDFIKFINKEHYKKGYNVDPVSRTLNKKALKND